MNQEKEDMHFNARWCKEKCKRFLNVASKVSSNEIPIREYTKKCLNRSGKKNLFYVPYRKSDKQEV